jgi:uncharacterized protein with FMN-binding domain
MTKAHPVQRSGPVQTIKQLLLSSVVVATFSAYTLYEHFVGGDTSVAATRANPDATRSAAHNTPGAATRNPQQADSSGTASSATPSPTSTPTRAAVAGNTSPAVRPSPTALRIAPSATPAPTKTPLPAQAGATFKDGEYVGDPKNAFYGLVQVKAVIQGGQLANVDFLTYPSDRRTSQRINQIANPMLQDEAIKAQNSQVDIISGATLTSRAFIQSLQTALAKAKP